jgi:hypothetical protein
MLLPLLRNPLVRLLAQLWWLPTFTLAVVWGFARKPDWQPAGTAGAACLAAVIGIVGAAGVHGACAAIGERARRRVSRRRFVCPHCLHFAPFRFACGACDNEVEAFLVYTNGAYVDDCPHCHAPLLSPGGWGVQAYCQWCKAHSERSIYHQRQVRAFATLLPADFATLCDAIGAEATPQQGIDCCWHDDGARLTCVLQPGDRTGAAPGLPRRNALLVSVESIWLDGTGIEPLQLGQAVDRFIVQAALTEAHCRALRICVRQRSLEPAARNVLATRFGTVRYGIAPEAFLRAATRSAR